MSSSWRPDLPTASIALGVSLLLTACGGNDGGDLRAGGQPAGYAYVASSARSTAQDPGTVLQYSIGSNGSLTSLTTASVPAGVNPVAIISDPTGRYVYVFNQGDGTISQYSVGAGGVLAPLSPATVGVKGTFPVAAGYSLSVNPSSHSLYLGIPGTPLPPTITAIVQYAINNNGTLSPLNPAAVTIAAAIGTGPLAFDASGTHAYLAALPGIGEALSADGEVLEFSVAAGGELTPVPSHTVTGIPNPAGITISPSGRTAYVLSTCIDDACLGQIEEYSLGESGLTSTGATVRTGSHIIPVSLTIDTAESAAYLLTNAMGVDTNAGAVYQYAINSAGNLVPATPPSLDVSSGAVAQTILGANLYALSSNIIGFASGGPPGGHIDHYSIGAEGLLAKVSTTDIASGDPTAMTLIPGH